MTTVIDLPCDVGLTSTRFLPVRPRSLNRMEGRRTEEALFGTPYWSAEYSTPTQNLAHIGRLDAFAMRVEGGAVFKGFDTTRPRPLDYISGPLSGTKAGGGAFDGTATITSINSATSITIGGLPASFQFRAGDYISFVESALVVSLHRIVADVLGSALGAATLSIMYPLDTENFTTAADVLLEKPYCLMKIAGHDAARRKGDRGFSFSAEEVFFYELEEED